MTTAERSNTDCIVVIGNFDGVHRGHQAVLVDAAREARERGLGATLLTFDPHPALALGRSAPPMLTTLARKLELIASIAPSIRPAIERFDAAFAAQSPEQFARSILRERLAARVVVVGHNFRFGKARAGDFDELTRLGKSMGFETQSSPLAGDARGPWSSTRIREAVALGEIEEATRMLGRPHSLAGVVVEGDRRGRTIGFPTCNVANVAEALPPNGVYAVLVDRDQERIAKGVANLGVRPTVKEGQMRRSLEVHLFDWDQDLYGATLRVHLVSRLRAEQKFAGLDELKTQIAKDVATAREKLSSA